MSKNIKQTRIKTHLETQSPSGLKIVFFGTPEVAVYVLDELEKAGVLPELVVTAPDKPKGRKLILTPPPAKVWAVEHGIPVEQSRKLSEITDKLKSGEYDLFIVAAYGKIIPKEILDIPRYGTLNVHPSLLPRLRGASPIQSAILKENETGVSIMVLDEEMDHGPIVARETWKSSFQVETGFPSLSSIYHKELEEKLARMGGRLLAEVIPKWIKGEIKPKEQEHDKATYCEKITKQDGLITEKDSPETIVRKVRAFTPWPGAYFFANPSATPEAGGGNGGKRIIITDAEMQNGALVIKRVKPEGKKEMPLEDFLRGNKEAGSYIKKLMGEDVQKRSQHGAD